MTKLLGTAEINLAVLKENKPGAVLDWIQDWDDNSTLIDDERVISPKMFTGIKDSSGYLTGIAMGRSISRGEPNNIGIIGYNKSIKTFEINALDGSATFGQKGKTAINLYPNGVLDVSANITIGGRSGQNGYIEILDANNNTTFAAGAGGIYANSIQMRKDLGSLMVLESRSGISQKGADGYNANTAMIDIEGDKFLLTQTKDMGGVLVFDDTEINPGAIQMRTRDSYTVAGKYNYDMILNSYGIRIGYENADLNSIELGYDRGVMFKKKPSNSSSPITAVLDLNYDGTMMLGHGLNSYWQFKKNKVLSVPGSIYYQGSDEQRLVLEGSNAGLYLNPTAMGYYNWSNNKAYFRIDVANSEVRTDAGWFATGGPRMITGRGSWGYISWGNSDATKFRMELYTNTENNACANSLTKQAPSLKLHSGSGSGLHILPAGDTAGGMVVARGTSWGNYGDITCNKTYNMSDARYKKDIEDLETMSKSRNLTDSIALDIISNAKVYSYKHTYDDDSLPKSFGLMAQDLPVELTKQFIQQENPEDFSNTTRLSAAERNLEKEDIAVDLYGLISIAWEGLRVLMNKISQLENQISEFKDK